MTDIACADASSFIRASITKDFSTISSTSTPYLGTSSGSSSPYAGAIVEGDVGYVVLASICNVGQSVNIRPPTGWTGLGYYSTNDGSGNWSCAVFPSGPTYAIAYAIFTKVFSRSDNVSGGLTFNSNNSGNWAVSGVWLSKPPVGSNSSGGPIGSNNSRSTRSPASNQTSTGIGGYSLTGSGVKPVTLALFIDNTPAIQGVPTISRQATSNAPASSTSYNTVSFVEQPYSTSSISIYFGIDYNAPTVASGDTFIGALTATYGSQTDQFGYGTEILLGDALATVFGYANNAEGATTGVALSYSNQGPANDHFAVAATGTSSISASTTSPLRGSQSYVLNTVSDPCYFSIDNVTTPAVGSTVPRYNYASWRIEFSLSGAPPVGGLVVCSLETASGPVGSVKVSSAGQVGILDVGGSLMNTTGSALIANDTYTLDVMFAPQSVGVTYAMNVYHNPVDMVNPSSYLLPTTTSTTIYPNNASAIRIGPSRDTSGNSAILKVDSIVVLPQYYGFVGPIPTKVSLGHNVGLQGTAFVATATTGSLPISMKLSDFSATHLFSNQVPTTVLSTNTIRQIFMPIRAFAQPGRYYSGGRYYKGGSEYDNQPVTMALVTTLSMASSSDSDSYVLRAVGTRVQQPSDPIGWIDIPWNESPVYLTQSQSYFSSVNESQLSGVVILLPQSSTIRTSSTAMYPSNPLIYQPNVQLTGTGSTLTVNLPGTDSNFSSANFLMDISSSPIMPARSYIQKVVSQSATGGPSSANPLTFNQATSPGSVLVVIMAGATAYGSSSVSAVTDPGWTATLVSATPMTDSPSNYGYLCIYTKTSLGGETYLNQTPPTSNSLSFTTVFYEFPSGTVIKNVSNSPNLVANNPPIPVSTGGSSYNLVIASRANMSSQVEQPYVNWNSPTSGDTLIVTSGQAAGFRPVSDVSIGVQKAFSNSVSTSYALITSYPSPSLNNMAVFSLYVPTSITQLGYSVGLMGAAFSATKTTGALPINIQMKDNAPKYIYSSQHPTTSYASGISGPLTVTSQFSVGNSYISNSGRYYKLDSSLDGQVVQMFLLAPWARRDSSLVLSYETVSGSSYSDSAGSNDIPISDMSCVVGGTDQLNPSVLFGSTTVAGIGNLTGNNPNGPLSIPASSVYKTPSLTLSFWFAVNLSANDAAPLAVYNSTSSTQATGLYTRGGNLYVGLQASGGQIWQDLVCPLPNDGTWHNLTLTYDGNTTIVYVDGVSRYSSIAAQGPLPWNGTAVWKIFGNEYTGNSSGVVSHVMIFNRAIAAAEVLPVAKTVIQRNSTDGSNDPLIAFGSRQQLPSDSIGWVNVPWTSPASIKNDGTYVSGIANVTSYVADTTVNTITVGDITSPAGGYIDYGNSLLRVPFTYNNSPYRRSYADVQLAQSRVNSNIWVNKVQGTISGGPSQTKGITIPPTTAGNKLLAVLQWFGAPPSLPTGWSLIGNATVDSNIAIYTKTTTGENNIPVVQPSDGSEYNYIVYEFSSNNVIGNVVTALSNLPKQGPTAYTISTPHTAVMFSFVAYYVYTGSSSSYPFASFQSPFVSDTTVATPTNPNKVTYTNGPSIALSSAYSKDTFGTVPVRFDTPRYPTNQPYNVSQQILTVSVEQPTTVAGFNINVGLVGVASPAFNQGTRSLPLNASLAATGIVKYTINTPVSLSTNVALVGVPITKYIAYATLGTGIGLVAGNVINSTSQLVSLPISAQPIASATPRYIDVCALPVSVGLAGLALTKAQTSGYASINVDLHCQAVSTSYQVVGELPIGIFLINSSFPSFNVGAATPTQVGLVGVPNLRYQASSSLAFVIGLHGANTFTPGAPIYNTKGYILLQVGLTATASSRQYTTGVLSIDLAPSGDVIQSFSASGQLPVTTTLRASYYVPDGTVITTSSASSTVEGLEYVTAFTTGVKNG